MYVYKYIPGFPAKLSSESAGSAARRSGPNVTAAAPKVSRSWFDERSSTSSL